MAHAFIPPLFLAALPATSLLPLKARRRFFFCVRRRFEPELPSLWSASCTSAPPLGWSSHWSLARAPAM
eukprot:scaffold102312_cov60-Phaeocystis_antarctica.AAC.4